MGFLLPIKYLCFEIYSLKYTKTDLHILLIDNYDSFSFNLIDLLRKFDDVRVTICKNDDDEILSLDYQGVIISPGPGLPEGSGLLLEAIQIYISYRIPILGVCLGLQALVVALGGSLRKMYNVKHGIRDTLIFERDSILFKNKNEPYHVGRYHSWVADKLPNSLICTARTSDGEIMAVENECAKLYGVQFHPESYMSSQGLSLIKSFLEIC